MTLANTTVCNNSTLTAYVPTEDNPWDIQKINHLYRRAGFGATPEMLASALEKTPAEVVDDMITQAANATPTEAPIWADYRNYYDFSDNNLNGGASKTGWQRQIIRDFDENEGGLNDRLTLFWSNLLVASYQGYEGAPLFYKYYNLLQRNASGNFKDFVHEVGLNTAMLKYLNGLNNISESPNENYARELLELFTLGVDNGYTQEDIEEIARALTGWNYQEYSYTEVIFTADTFDSGSKTIFGRTGNWGYDDVINILFEEKEVEIAEYVCEQIYKHFVGSEINKVMVRRLAKTFVRNDFDILPVMSRLLKSEHFYDVAATSVMIKSPIDLEISLRREMNLQYATDYDYVWRIKNSVFEQGQQVLEHGSVEGWAGEEDWINPSTLVNKWNQLDIRLTIAYKHVPSQFSIFLNQMLGSVSNDIEFVTQSILDFFFSNESIDEITYQGALVAFKDNVPQNYFDDGTWNTEWSDSIPNQMYKLMLYIIKIPEFQLK